MATAPTRSAKKAPATIVRLQAMPSASLGKYREIIIAVGFFLLFDLGVLVLNFYTSFQITEDAVGINLAGRQRMLTQRTAKALFALEAAKAKSADSAKDVQELKAAVALFDASLKGFQAGATVPGGNGKPTYLRAAEGENAAAILAKAQSIWSRYQTVLAPVLGGAGSDADLASAVDYAKANNQPLLALMNELTTALEAVAAERANTLRLVQTVGIALALLNFAFILFKFLRRLRASDAAIDAATEENREILQSVREGLFLLTPQHTLGSQFSQSAPLLFGSRLAAGDNFFELLAPLVSASVLQDARDYVDLLFSPHVKEALAQDLNPLLQVRASIENRLGHTTVRHLSFQFNRVLSGGVVRHLLVTVQDISSRVELEAKLQGERERARQEFAALLKAFDADPTLLRQFVASAEQSLLAVNDLLRSTSAAPGHAAVTGTISEVFRRIHAIKGDASMLGLDTLASQAHALEAQLQTMKKVGATGDDLLALPLPLEDLLSKVGALKSLGTVRKPQDASPSEADIAQALGQLARTVATDTGKQVQSLVRLAAMALLPMTQQSLLREMAVQLVRNAVAHGIERPLERSAAGKPAEGKVEVDLLPPGDPLHGEWTLTVRDDGAGIEAAQVRQRLLALGWYTPAQLDCFSDTQIVGHIFKPGFSTELAESLHAGRGVGLDLVQAHVQKLGAQLQLATTPGQFTEFKIRFST